MDQVNKYSHWLVFVAPLHRSVPYRKAPPPREFSCPAMQKRQSEKMSIRWVTLWKEEAPTWREWGRRPSTAVTTWLLHRLVMKIARALTKDVHVRCFTCVCTFNYGRNVIWTTSRKVLRLHADIKMPMKDEVFNPGWLIYDITNAFSIHLKILQQSIFYLHNH